jgi:hypothetical protein
MNFPPRRDRNVSFRGPLWHGHCQSPEAVPQTSDYGGNSQV